MIARRLIHGCAAACSRLSPGGAFAMPTLLHVAASARLFLDAWHTLPRLGLILIAWRAWFDLAAFWISGIHCRALAAFGRLTFVGCFDAGCRAFRLRCFCALVSENATRGARLQPDIRCERSNRVFAMGHIMTKAQVVAASWLRDSSLSVDGEAPFSHFLPARSSFSAIGPHCAIF